MFVFSLLGMIFSGHAAYNTDLAEHGISPIGLGPYLLSGNFQSSLFENWRANFCRWPPMSCSLRCCSSADLPSPAIRTTPTGTATIFLQEIARHQFVAGLFLLAWTPLAALFVCSFVLHRQFRGGQEEARLYGGQVEPIADHLFSSKLWFESFQNWQSEFLSTALLVVLSIVSVIKDRPIKPVGGERGNRPVTIYFPKSFRAPHPLGRRCGPGCSAIEEASSYAPN